MLTGGNGGEDKDGTDVEAGGVRLAPDGSVCGIEGGARVAAAMEDAVGDP